MRGVQDPEWASLSARVQQCKPHGVGPRAFLAQSSCSWLQYEIKVRSKRKVLGSVENLLKQDNGDQRKNRRSTLFDASPV